jgi:hypothetical protein
LFASHSPLLQRQVESMAMAFLFEFPVLPPF